jgi:ABC-type amino acid transport substrate-binding protein
VRDWELPVLFLLAGTLRPEGAAAALPALLVWLAHHRNRQAPWLWTGAAAAVGAGYFLWRWTYYGYLLPNTFYVKFGNVDAGAQWITTTAAVVAPLAVLTLALLATRTTRRGGLLLTATVATTYLTYAVSGPSMDYVHRFAFHAYPLLCLGASVAISSWSSQWVVRILGATTVVWVAVAGLRSSDLAIVGNYASDLQRTHVAIGRGLARAPIPSEARTLAVSDAGAIPYFSRWDTIDYIGLNNEPITHGANPTTVIESARPTVIVVTSSSERARRFGYGVDIAQVTAGYEQIASVHMRDNYWQLVFAAPRWADTLRGPLNRAIEQAQADHDPGRYDITLDRWVDRLRDQVPGVAARP